MTSRYPVYFSFNANNTSEDNTHVCLKVRLCKAELPVEIACCSQTFAIYSHLDCCGPYLGS